MNEGLKLYIAGKVNPHSIFGTKDWRVNFCNTLEEKTGLQIINLDPTKTPKTTEWDENNPSLVFGRDCFMISNADVVIVYLTDDISVGGSQEMLIAKYFKKPLIGLAPRNGKFNKNEKEIGGRIYKNWKCPFVLTTCDVIAETVEEVATCILQFEANPRQTIKDISLINEQIDYYKKKMFVRDEALQFLKER